MFKNKDNNNNNSDLPIPTASEIQQVTSKLKNAFKDVTENLLNLGKVGVAGEDLKNLNSDVLAPIENLELKIAEANTPKESIQELKESINKIKNKNSTDSIMSELTKDGEISEDIKRKIRDNIKAFSDKDIEKEKNNLNFGSSSSKPNPELNQNINHAELHEWAEDVENSLLNANEEMQLVKRSEPSDGEEEWDEVKLKQLDEEKQEAERIIKAYLTSIIGLGGVLREYIGIKCYDAEKAKTIINNLTDFWHKQYEKYKNRNRITKSIIIGLITTVGLGFALAIGSKVGTGQYITVFQRIAEVSSSILVKTKKEGGAQTSEKISEHIHSQLTAIPPEIYEAFKSYIPWAGPVTTGYFMLKVLIKLLRK